MKPIYRMCECEIFESLVGFLLHHRGQFVACFSTRNAAIKYLAKEFAGTRR